MGNNFSTLQHILEHCYTIEEYLIEGNVQSFEDFNKNKLVHDAVVMRLLAMGELTTHLTDEFKSSHSVQIDWRNLKQLRNIIAHRYGTIQFHTIWEIIQNDVPTIRDFCLSQTEQPSDCSEAEDNEN